MPARVAIAAQHQQVCIEPAALRDESLGNLVLDACRAIFSGIDAVMPEVLHSVITLQRIRFRWVFALHDEGANRFRLMQVREGFGKCARAPEIAFFSDVSCCCRSRLTIPSS